MRVQMLWQSSHHNAFTDLIYYREAWYCVFREGSTHMSYDGQIVVLYSTDTQNWQEHSRLAWQGGDLRDPKLSVSPNNHLIMTAGIRWAVYSTEASRLYSVGWSLDQSKEAWSLPIIDKTGEGTWRWATTWHHGLAYSVGHSGHDQQGCLYRSEDGLNWQVCVSPFFPDSKVFTNESSLVSDNETLWCLTRRDAAGGAKAILGSAASTLDHWRWQTLPVSIGGPKLLQLSNGEWVMAVRRINYKRWTAKTVLYKLNPKKNVIKHWQTLPSSGDTSYPGLVEYNGQLHVSYYSTDVAGQTLILLAVLPLKIKKRSKRFR